MTLFYPFRGTKVSPGGTDGKENACNAGDPSLIPGSGRSPGRGHGNPLQYSYLENSTGVTESDMTEGLRTHTHD